MKWPYLNIFSVANVYWLKMNGLTISDAPILKCKQETIHLTAYGAQRLATSKKIETTELH